MIVFPFRQKEACVKVLPSRTSPSESSPTGPETSPLVVKWKEQSQVFRGMFSAFVPAINASEVRRVVNILEAG
jgi:hypothetical protein